MRPLVAIFLPNLAGGGAEKVLVALSGAFVSSGVGCDIVLVKSGGELLPLVPKGVRVIDLQADKPRSAILPLARYLRSERPNALLASLPLTNIAALIVTKLLRASNTRTVIRFETREDLFKRATGKQDPLGDRILKRYLFRRADASIAVSRDVSNWLIESGLTSKTRTHLIYNPIIGATTIARHGENRRIGRTPTVLACGRLIAQKDHDTLLRAFARVRARRPCRLVILGDGPLRAPLEDLASELGISNSVSFEGYVADPMEYMSAASVFVHTSLFEGFGNVLLEALTAGCPIIATDGPGAAREVLGNGKYGVMVPIGDYVAIASAVEAILDDRVSLPVPGDYLRKFDIETVAKQHLTLLLHDE